MRNLARLLQSLICLVLLVALLGCTATKQSESTGQYVDDSIITTKVKAAIFQVDALKSLQINVKTYKSIVQLSGFVDTAEHASRAGQVAGTVAGVVSVENDLIVK